ncbi:MAG: precorrin-8X methylmutase, partial [Clostridia bacterium]|nr:precorrin-8X methylmutase [Clostridia bacterium]
MTKLLHLLPAEIEAESFRIITEELGDRQIDPALAPILKRVIHTTADFDYADTLYVSEGAIEIAKQAIRDGAT